MISLVQTLKMAMQKASKKLGRVFFKFGRFPGSDKLVVLPQCELPKFIKVDTAISPIDLFKKV